jgi:Ser/Thr protein kinase RdoA (MazF antagonist)
MIQSFEILEWFNHTYSLGNGVASELIRSYTNDVFLVRTSHHQYVFKLYGLGWRTESELQYEVALLNHLARKGLRVANTIVGNDGQTIHKIHISNSERYAILFEYADGKKPQPPFSNQLYYAFGQAIGRMHGLSDAFAGEYGGSSLDLISVVDVPLKLALPLIDDAEDRLYLQEVAEKVKNRITELDAHRLDWGPIHGDATLDNLHVTDDGQIVLYDFDTGGPGWRAADLQGWAKNNDEYAER